jgi:hypothetical protein
VSARTRAWSVGGTLLTLIGLFACSGAPVSVAGKGSPEDKAAPADAAEAERCEREMLAYELAYAEYQAAAKLKTGRRLLDEARAARAKGGLEGRDAERMEDAGRRRLTEVIRLHPDTAAAEDARRLLAGEAVAERALPPPPKLPHGIKAEEPESSQEPKQAPAAGTKSEGAAPGQSGPAAGSKGGSGRPVAVRGYYRPDGTYVPPHTLLVPNPDGGRPR